ncbi:permease prefix domain 1-containing protein [Paenibacillus sp. MMS18-CY102]|uniref:permease prefix domain 1-containing protein n=1 Tax=Paenibacillus sp. MMS18-CY102 TaxID=2682849 RepID=UPI0013661C8D|nr:permease prefix domain 1-containing protein [Paenibacillus sp. MMS18-CY102]MWC30760.1 hypothetical protein [Paenibacillus sp. MMS18-CY102]
MVKAIDRYVHSLSKHVNLESEEMASFQDEIRSHLAESVNALRLEGYSEKESVAIALRRFGEESNLNAELRREYRFHRSFKKWMLAVSVLFLALSVFFVYESRALEERGLVNLDYMNNDFDKVEDLMGKTNSVPYEVLKAYVERHEGVVRYVLLTQKKRAVPIAEYAYPIEHEPYDPQDVYYLPQRIETEVTGIQWYANIYYNNSAIYPPQVHAVYVTGVVCFALYWILFGLWNVLNAHRRGSLNVFWVVCFFSLNVVAYLLYKAVELIRIGRFRAAV